ncbi:MAG: putative Ig domain-containing protein [candidate division KSB1 bacterium]|nr:putative Ig domain-containing protein [candidate division KSB1 bacterium]
MKSNPNEQLGRTLYFRNVSDRYEFDGQFTVSIKTLDKGREIYTKSVAVDLNSGALDSFQYEFNCDLQRMHKAEYVFTARNFDKSVAFREQVPYILTPPPGDAPSINGPMVYGQRPGNPFLYRIPVSGKRPLEFSAENLPDGLTLDPRTGIITGRVETADDYSVTVRVDNEAGMDEKEMTFKIGDQLSLTPPMGWNSWNCWGLTVSDAKVREAADFMVSTGLVNYGWSFINIDDGWEAPARSYTGEIRANDKFPDMKALGDYVHEKGLKFGIYSSPGPLTCGGYLGSYRHEEQDIHTYCDWGVDYLKYDWCSYERIAEDHSLDELQKPYFRMRDVITEADRDIVYSLCQYGMGNVWQWGKQAGGNLWRTTGDIRDTWTSMSEIGFGQDSLWRYAEPGHWNDPDMLVVGHVGWGPAVHPSQLSYSEQYTHITLWSLLSAPMLLGCDLSKLDDFTLNLLCNAEVIAVNQDPLGEQARSFVKNDDLQIWAKRLSDGSAAVGCV